MIENNKILDLTNISFKANLNIHGENNLTPNELKRLNKIASKIGSGQDVINVDVWQSSGFDTVNIGMCSQDGCLDIEHKYVPTILGFDAKIGNQDFSGHWTNSDEDILDTDYDAINKILKWFKKHPKPEE